MLSVIEAGLTKDALPGLSLKVGVCQQATSKASISQQMNVMLLTQAQHAMQGPPVQQ